MRIRLISPLFGLSLIFANSFPATAQNSDLPLFAVIENGTAYGSVRLRYETVDQDNALKDADAVTVRTRLGYKTGQWRGLSAAVEFEDSRVIADQDDYNNSLGHKPGFSVIADPETTEVDQLWLRWAPEAIALTLGRQIVTFDNQRHVGHVGWRQDRQTFDAARLDLSLHENGISASYVYITRRNRIFAETRDLDSKDHLINANWQSPIGKVSGYGYFLELDSGVANGLDTYGVRLTGKTDIADATVRYTAEYARQANKQTTSTVKSDYGFLKLETTVAKIDFDFTAEILGSDSGQGAFATPLGTVHKFNGWADQFLITPNQGLVDLALSVSLPLAGGKLVITGHDFTADDSTPSIDDLGYEVDAQYSRKLGKHLKAVLKYADYQAGDPAANKVDTRKLWSSLEFSF